jgi:hypothetical protein
MIVIFAIIFAALTAVAAASYIKQQPKVVITLEAPKDSSIDMTVRLRKMGGIAPWDLHNAASYRGLQSR